MVQRIKKAHDKLVAASMDKKEHYKLYKSGKQWLIAGVMLASFAGSFFWINQVKDAKAATSDAVSQYGSEQQSQSLQQSAVSLTNQSAAATTTDTAATSSAATKTTPVAESATTSSAATTKTASATDTTATSSISAETTPSTSSAAVQTKVSVAAASATGSSNVIADDNSHITVQDGDYQVYQAKNFEQDVTNGRGLLGKQANETLGAIGEFYASLIKTKRKTSDDPNPASVVTLDTKYGVATAADPITAQYNFWVNGTQVKDLLLENIKSGTQAYTDAQNAEIATLLLAAYQANQKGGNNKVEVMGTDQADGTTWRKQTAKLTFDPTVSANIN